MKPCFLMAFIKGNEVKDLDLVLCVILMCTCVSTCRSNQRNENMIESESKCLHSNDHYRPQRSWGKVIFSEACVHILSRGGACMVAQGGHAWLLRGGCAWLLQGGVSFTLEEFEFST